MYAELRKRLTFRKPGITCESKVSVDETATYWKQDRNRATPHWPYGAQIRVHQSRLSAIAAWALESCSNVRSSNRETEPTWLREFRVIRWINEDQCLTRGSLRGSLALTVMATCSHHGFNIGHPGQTGGFGLTSLIRTPRVHHWQHQSLVPLPKLRSDHSLIIVT